MSGSASRSARKRELKKVRDQLAAMAARMGRTVLDFKTADELLEVAQRIQKRIDALERL